MVLNRIVSAVFRRRRSSPQPDLQVEEANDTEACEDFESSLRRNFDILRLTGLPACECATYALRITARAVQPVDISRLQELRDDSGKAHLDEIKSLLLELFKNGDQLFVSLAIYCHRSQDLQVDGTSEQLRLPASECPIDLGKVHNLFNLLCATVDSETMGHVTEQLCTLVKVLLPKSLMSMSDVAVASILATLSVLPMTQEVSNRESFVEPLIAIFSSERERISEPLRAAFTSCPQAPRTAATFAIQQFLTLRLYSRSSLDVLSVAAVHVLAVLHTANLASSAPAPSETFHNDVINSEDFNLKQDWLRSHQKEVFSFARFPFLYAPAAKARLLRFNATAEMQQGMPSMLRMGGSPIGFAADGAALFRGHFGGMHSSPHLQLKVRRGPNLLQDTLTQIRAYLPSDAGGNKALRRPLRVSFVDEQGIDEGGISREFFQLIIKELMNSRYGLFTCDPETHVFWIRPSSVHQMVAEFELIGIIVGLAIHNSHILGLSLARTLYKKLLGSPLGLSDLQEMHSDVHNSLNRLLDHDADRVEGDMCLTFRVSHEVDFEPVNHDLVPNGDSIPVTGQNRREFVDKYVQFLLVDRVAPQFEAFERGFSHVCDRKLMEMFRPCPHELEEVVCGTQTLDLDDLMRSAVYEGGYTEKSDAVMWLWEVLESCNEVRKRQFLQFVTGADRAPVGGLGSLTPRFKIMKNGGHSERLPTAHVCFNILLLPHYDSKEWLADRLYKAIENDHGFGLM